MIFKPTKFKLGAGTNLHGIMVDGRVVIYYLSSEPSGVVIKTKSIKRRDGVIDTKKEDFTLEAREVVPCGGALIASRGEKQIKMVKRII